MYKRRQSGFVEDEMYVLSDEIEKGHRLTPFMITISNITIPDIDIRRLIELGLHIIRFEISNVTNGDKIKLLSTLESAVEYCCDKYEVSAWPIAVSIDLPHFCIRTGLLSSDPKDQHRLIKGHIVELTSNIKFCESCSNSRIFINDNKILNKVKEGTEVTLNCGNIGLICTNIIDFQTIKCKVIKEGELGNYEYVCFRGIPREVPEGLSKVDLEQIQFAKQYNLSVITINVVHSPITLNMVRALYPSTEAPMLFSTICDQEGLDNVDAIIEESDGIILAREFLVFHITDMHRMHSIQLQISAKCRKSGKPFFISGNILERTLRDGKIALGDLSDINNAIAYRTGIVLQSYHDIDHLIHTVKIFDSLCRSYEYRTRDKEFWHEFSKNKLPVNAAEGSAIGCAIAARQMRAVVIIVPTVSGKTAEQLTRVETDKIIITVSSNPMVARKLQMFYGTCPIIYDRKPKKTWQEEMTARIQFAICYGIKHRLLKYGSTYVVLRKSNAKSAYADTINICTVTVDEELNNIYFCKVSETKDIKDKTESELK